MQEYLHMNPNFGKHKIIPFLLLLPVVAFALVFFAASRQIDETQQVASATSVPTIEKKQIIVNDHTIPVEISDSEEERRQGLSNRPPLTDGHGMLFIFPTENVRGGFWMKDMYFDIDMIWINDGKIIQIDKNVPAPELPTNTSNLPIYTPNDAYDYVLEMNAGSADKFGFEVGDIVTIPTL